MKATFLLVLVVAGISAAAQNPKTYIDRVYPPKSNLVDERGVGLGLLIGENQKINEKWNKDLLITPPTVIKAEKQKNGMFFLQCYVNTDWINIIARNVNTKNAGRYTAYYQLVQPGRNPKVDKKQAQIAAFGVSKDNPTILYINDLNKYKTQGNSLFVFVEDKKSGEIVSMLYLDYVFPIPEPFFFSLNKKLIDYADRHPGLDFSYDGEHSKSSSKEIQKLNESPTTFYPNCNLPYQLILPPDQNSILLQFKSLINEVYLNYQLDENESSATPKKFSPAIILKDIAPGRHTLKVWYGNQHDKAFNYEFEIKPRLIESVWFRWLIVAFIILSGLGIYTWLRYKNQKKLVQDQKLHRQQLQSQISSLRSQLNPHFIFNALNSIQALINKDDKEKANLYISKFGGLLRAVLEQRDNIMHPLTIEIEELETYLNLEQLRYKFNYDISVDTAINPNELDFPIMLLQPFVENAIKHGIAGKRETGVISLKFLSLGSILKIVLTDNGIGFDQNGTAEGYGIKLIRDRIAMLNEWNKDQRISLILESDVKGTKVEMLFENWV